MPPAMVLAAGLGTRLRPLTDAVAKPLVPIGDRPMLAHVVARLRVAGFAPVVANAFHHREEVTRFCDEAGVLVSREDELLGTAGGLTCAAHLLGDGDVLVHNGDVLVDVDLAALVRTHEVYGAAATLAVVARSAGEGNVGFDEHGVVVRLRKETFARGETSGGDFTGVHVASARARASMPAKGCVVGDVYMPRLRGKSADLYVHHARSFTDVGTLESYLDANLAWLAPRGPSWVGEGAVVDAAVTLDRSIVGAGAKVSGEGMLARCVVWPNAVAVAPLADAVVTSAGVVRVTRRT